MYVITPYMPSLCIQCLSSFKSSSLTKQSAVELLSSQYFSPVHINLLYIIDLELLPSPAQINLLNRNSSEL